MRRYMLSNYQLDVLSALLANGRALCLGNKEARFGGYLARALSDQVYIERRHHGGSLTITLRPDRAQAVPERVGKRKLP